MTLLDIQISIEDGPWLAPEVLEQVSARVLGTAADVLALEEKQPFPQMACEVSLVFTDDAAIQAINAEWRGQDKPTNVLSFPSFPVLPGKMPGPMLGDIILAHETLVREAADLEKPFDDHLTHLLVHGFLHLFGYDHIEEQDAERMEGLELAFWPVLGYLIRMGIVIPFDSLER